MKFCHNTNFTLPKQSQRSRSVFQDGSRSLGLFWKENNLSYNRRNTVLAALNVHACSHVFHFQQNVQYEFAVNLYLKFLVLLITKFAFNLHNHKALCIRQKSYRQTKSSQKQNESILSFIANQQCLQCIR